MADTIVKPTDVFRTKPATKGWNVYRSVAEIESGTVIHSYPGSTLLGTFVRDVQTKRGWYSLMNLAIPIQVKVSIGLLSTKTETLTQIYIQNQGFEKAVLYPYKIAAKSTISGYCNRRTGPSTDSALIQPALAEGASAGQSDGTAKNGYLALYDSSGRVQFVSKTFLTRADTPANSTGGTAEKPMSGIENRLETATSAVNWSLLLRSAGIAVSAILLFGGLAWMVGKLQNRRKVYR